MSGDVQRRGYGQTSEAFADAFDALSYGDDGIKAVILRACAPAFYEFVRGLLEGREHE